MERQSCMCMRKKCMHKMGSAKYQRRGRKVIFQDCRQPGKMCAAVPPSRPAVPACAELRPCSARAEAAAGVEHDLGLLKARIKQIGTADANGNLQISFGELFRDETLERVQRVLGCESSRRQAIVS